MASERWSAAPRRLALFFLTATLIPITALGWLTAQLVDRDRRLETQHAQERAERAADRIVAASHQRLSELETELRRLIAREREAPPDHTLLAIAEGERITVAPAGALVYHPVLAKTGEPPRDTFAEGERYEHRDGNPAKALEWFRALARTSDPAVRAGALLRLGRNQQKLGQTENALSTYAELATLGDTPIEGLPAAMLALVARCEVLEKAGRQTELRMTAASLRKGLGAGTWPLLREPYDFYAREARRWNGEPDDTDSDRTARAVAAALQSTYERWATGGAVPQRQWLIAESRPVLLASAATPERLIALVAGPEFLQDAWKDVSGAEILLTDGDGRPILGAFRSVSAPQAVRTTDVSKLPWTLRVSNIGMEADPGDAVMRRRLLLTGLAMVLLLFGGSAYFTLRSVTRELAVARLQSDFVAAVSHEFRTPLASVRHLSEMLSRGRVADEAQRQHCYDFISRESERLEHLVEELLDFGRLEGGAYPYRFVHIDACALLRELVGEFQEKVESKGYRIELSIEPDKVPVLADRDALARAIWNLLDNAVKYSPAANTIWVALTREGGSAVIRVKDEGLGIAVSEQKQIFGKFVRGSNARTQQIKGTGIGLAMVRHIVEAHRGEVRVESQPDQGSTFALLLPIERPA